MAGKLHTVLTPGLPARRLCSRFLVSATPMRLLPFLATCAALATLSPGVTALSAADAPAPNASAPKAKAKAPAPKAAPAKKPRTVKMFMRDGLRFEPPRFVAEPGEEIIVEIENNDSTDQTHNFVLLRPGTRDAVVQAGLALAEKGPALEYVPPSADVLVHSRLLTAEGSGSMQVHRADDPGDLSLRLHVSRSRHDHVWRALRRRDAAADRERPEHPADGRAGRGRRGGQRPFAQRIFMPDAGPAAVAIALVGSQNVCWDAGQCRLRYAWQGSFIDASENWAGNGKILPIVPPSRGGAHRRMISRCVSAPWIPLRPR